MVINYDNIRHNNHIEYKVFNLAGHRLIAGSSKVKTHNSLIIYQETISLILILLHHSSREIFYKKRC